MPRRNKNQGKILNAEICIKITTFTFRNSIKKGENDSQQKYVSTNIIFSSGFLKMST